MEADRRSRELCKFSKFSRNLRRSGVWRPSELGRQSRQSGSGCAAAAGHCRENVRSSEKRCLQSVARLHSPSGLLCMVQRYDDRGIPNFRSRHEDMKAEWAGKWGDGGEDWGEWGEWDEWDEDGDWGWDEGWDDGWGGGYGW